MLGLRTISTYAHQTSKTTVHSVVSTHTATKSTSKPVAVAVAKKTETKHVESSKPATSKHSNKLEFEKSISGCLF